MVVTPPRIRRPTSPAPPPALAVAAGASLGAASMLCAAWFWAGLAPGAVATCGIALAIALAGQWMAALRRSRGATGTAHAVGGVLVAMVACFLLPPLHGVARLVEPVMAATVLLMWWLAGTVWRAAIPPRSSAPSSPRAFDEVAELREALAGQLLIVGLLALLARMFHHTASPGARVLAVVGGTDQLFCGLALLATRVQTRLAAGGAAPGRISAGWVAAACVAVGLLLPAYGALALGGAGQGGGARATPPPTVPPSHLISHVHPTAARPGPGLPARHPAAWLPFVDHLIAAAAAVTLAFVIARWVYQTWREGGWLALWQGLIEWLRAIFGLLARLFVWPGRPGWLPGGRYGTPDDGADAARPGGGVRATDPRGRVRQAYRRLLRGAERRGLVRPPAHSPRRFGRRLEPQMGERGPDLRALTRLYEEARYSGHPVDAGTADRATAHARAAMRGLRDAERARRNAATPPSDGTPPPA